MFGSRSIKYQIASHLGRNDIINLMLTSKTWHESLSENYFWEFYIKKIYPHGGLTNFLEVYSSYKHLAVHLHHNLITFQDLEIEQPFTTDYYFSIMGTRNIATGPHNLQAYIHETWLDGKFKRQLTLKQGNNAINITPSTADVVKIKIYRSVMCVIDANYNLYTLALKHKYYNINDSDLNFKLIASNIFDVILTGTRWAYISTDNNLYLNESWNLGYPKLIDKNVKSISSNETHILYLTYSNQIYIFEWIPEKLMRIETDIVAKKIYLSEHCIGILDTDNVLYAKHTTKDNWLKINTNVTDVSFTDDLIGIIKDSNLYFIDPQLKFVQVHIASNITKISIYDRNNLLAIGYHARLLPNVIHELMNRAKHPKCYNKITDYDSIAFNQVSDEDNLVKKYSSNVYGLLNLFGKDDQIAKLLKFVNIDLNESSDVFAWDNRSSSTALNYAITRLDLDTVKYLLDKGANPWLRDIDGRNAFDALFLFCTDVTMTENKLKLFDSIPKISIRRDLYSQIKKKYRAIQLHFITNFKKEMNPYMFLCIKTYEPLVIL